MKKQASPALLLATLCLLAGCTTKTADASVLETGSPMAPWYGTLSAEDIQAMYGPQLLIPTAEATLAAYAINFTRGEGAGPYLSDFSEIQAVPIDQLLGIALRFTPAISIPFDHGEDGKVSGLRGKPDHVLTEVALRDEARGHFAFLSYAYYGSHADATLTKLFGPWPVAGESYIDHFADTEYITWYPKEGFLLQHGEGVGVYPGAQLLAYEETTGGLVICEAVLTYSYYIEGDLLLFDPELDPLTAENFAEYTEGLDRARYTFYPNSETGFYELRAYEKLA